MSARVVESPWLDINEAADYLRKGSRSAVMRLIREHRLPYRRCGNELRFHKRELDAWMTKDDGVSGETASQAPPVVGANVRAFRKAGRS